ncbi:MAG: ATP-binding protein [Bacteroidota bacterium]
MDIRHIIISLLTLLVSHTCFSNTQRIDSCLQELRAATSVEDVADHAGLLYETSIAYVEDEQYKASINYAKKSLAIAEREHYDSLAIKNMLLLGETFFWASEYDSSLLYLDQAMKFGTAKSVLTHYDSIDIYVGLGNTYYYMGILEESYKNRMLIVELTKNSTDSVAIANNIFALAELDREREKYDEALEKLAFCIGVFKSHDHPQGVGICYEMIGNIYFKKEDYQRALKNYQLGCEIDLASDSDYGKAYCYNNLGTAYTQLGDHEQAMNYLKKSLEIRLTADQREEIIESKIAMAELYMKMKKCDLANRLLTTCLEDAAIQNIKPIKRDIYEKMYKVNKGCGDFRTAFEYQEKYFKLRDSINNNITKRSLANLSSMHELETQKQRNELLQKEKELILMKQGQEVSELYTLVISFTLLFLVGVMLVGIWMYRKLYHYNNDLSTHKQQIEQQNQQLFETNNKLKSANGELEKFAYIASHDLKAPLRTVGSYASLLRRRYQNVIDENGQEFLELITSGVQHMSQLLEDVLAYSNVERGEMKTVRIDLNDLLGKVLQTLHANIKEKGALVSYDSLPTILGNRTQVFQIFQNLIANALKFVAEDTVPQIMIGTQRKADFYCFAIADNGIGIEPKYQAGIFTIFKRLHTQQEFKGTGIGLSICKKIVERHGGEIWLESDGKSGTTFFFTLPAAVIEENLVAEEMNAQG